MTLALLALCALVAAALQTTLAPGLDLVLVLTALAARLRGPLAGAGLGLWGGLLLGTPLGLTLPMGLTYATVGAVAGMLFEDRRVGALLPAAALPASRIALEGLVMSGMGLAWAVQPLAALQSILWTGLLLLPVIGLAPDRD